MKYLTPEMEIIQLYEQDIVCTSGGITDQGQGGTGSGNSETDAPIGPWGP